MIKFFRTNEHPCSYLPNHQSRTLFLDPDLIYSEQLYEELTHAGFRRSGKHLYKPDCIKCQSCIPSRIPVSKFKFTRRFKRVLKRNSDVHIEISPCEFREQDYCLFERYINLRHSDGDMYPPNQSNYSDFLAINNRYSFQVRYYLDEQLVGIAITDQMLSGLSSIYTFFDPNLDKRSLGVYSVLKQIELCRQFNLPYLYLGYWIPNCQKMAYKNDYQPLELLIDKEWKVFDSLDELLKK